MMNNKPSVRRKSLNSNSVLLVITIALFVVMYTAGCIVYQSAGFNHLQTFLNILIQNSGLICVACGMTAVMLTGGIDISVGALIAMDCMLIAHGVENWGIGAGWLIVAVLLIGVIFGAVQGFCVGYLGIQPFIVSMAGMFFARGMTAVINIQQVSMTSSELMNTLANTKLNIPFAIGAYTNSKGKLMIPSLRYNAIIALVVLVIIYIMLRYSRFGRSLYAVGGNQQSAALLGLDVNKTRMKAYMLSSFLTSIGAICYLLYTKCGTPTQAAGLEMDAISSAVIGGTLLTGGVGNVIGSFFGVLINGTIAALVKTNGKLSSAWPNVITAMLLCFFIILQAIFAKARERAKK